MGKKPERMNFKGKPRKSEICRSFSPHRRSELYGNHVSQETGVIVMTSCYVDIRDEFSYAEKNGND
jgi:hypothetical protein